MRDSSLHCKIHKHVNRYQVRLECDFFGGLFFLEHFCLFVLHSSLDAIGQNALLFLSKSADVFDDDRLKWLLNILH